MKVLIADIKVKKRIRKDLGNIPALADSLKKYGQINPIIITKKNVLVAGGRRLEAARHLGWRTINATVIDAPGELAKLEYEVEENVQRRDFSPLEAEEAARKLHSLRNPSFFRRVFNAIAKFFKRLFKIEDE